jgi:hypothetical protein
VRRLIQRQRRTWSSEDDRRLHLAGEFVVAYHPCLPGGGREVFRQRLFEGPEKRFAQRVMVGELDAVLDMPSATISDVDTNRQFPKGRGSSAKSRDAFSLANAQGNADVLTENFVKALTLSRRRGRLGGALPDRLFGIADTFVQWRSTLCGVIFVSDDDAGKVVDGLRRRPGQDATRAPRSTS